MGENVINIHNMNQLDGKNVDFVFSSHKEIFHNQIDPLQTKLIVMKNRKNRRPSLKTLKIY